MFWRRFARSLSGLALFGLVLSTMGCGAQTQQKAGGDQAKTPQPAAPGSTAPAPPEKAAKFTIGIPVLSLSFLPVYVAEEQGFYKEVGFQQVELPQFKGEADILQAVASGSVDLTVSSLTGLVQAIQQGQKWKAVWAGYNMPIFEWYGKPEFKSIADTKGGRYAVTTYGALTDILTRYALKKHGLDSDKDVKILQLGGSAQSVAALAAGQLEATILAHPLTYEAADKGFVKLMSQKDQIAPDWPTHVVYAPEDFIKKNPNTVKAFIRATTKAMDWIKANPDQAAEVANKRMKFKVEYAKRAIADMGDNWIPDGRLPQADKGMKVYWEIEMLVGDVKEPWPDSKWLDDSFLKTQDQWRK